MTEYRRLPIDPDPFRAAIQRKITQDLFEELVAEDLAAGKVKRVLIDGKEYVQGIGPGGATMKVPREHLAPLVANVRELPAPDPYLFDHDDPDSPFYHYDTECSAFAWYVDVVSRVSAQPCVDDEAMFKGYGNDVFIMVQLLSDDILGVIQAELDSYRALYDEECDEEFPVLTRTLLASTTTSALTMPLSRVGSVVWRTRW